MLSIAWKCIFQITFKRTLYTINREHIFTSKSWKHLLNIASKRIQINSFSRDLWMYLWATLKNIFISFVRTFEDPKNYWKTFLGRGEGGAGGVDFQTRENSFKEFCQTAWYQNSFKFSASLTLDLMITPPIIISSYLEEEYWTISNEFLITLNTYTDWIQILIAFDDISIFDFLRYKKEQTQMFLQQNFAVKSSFYWVIAFYGIERERDSKRYFFQF